MSRGQVTEAQRQHALLTMLASRDASLSAESMLPLALQESNERLTRGIEAYRTNAESIAERALAASFGTVRHLVGAEAFARLAADFWWAHAPIRGDLAEWGGSFAPWLGQHCAMRSLPYLEDCARLDRALFDNERAADAELDVASMSLLESADPSALRLHLMPGTALIRSAWPIAGIHAAHRLSGDDAEAAFAAVRVAIDAGRGEQVMVVRKGWRATLHGLDDATARWIESLLEGADFSAAIDRAGAGFNFVEWLASALRESWLQGASAARRPAQAASVNRVV
jgi:hypothetical protein